MAIKALLIVSAIVILMFINYRMIIINGNMMKYLMHGVDIDLNNFVKTSTAITGLTLVMYIASGITILFTDINIMDNWILAIALFLQVILFLMALVIDKWELD